MSFRYCAIIAYDGTDFYGFQAQAHERTVQGEIEKSLEQLTQSKIRISAAGRTDAGVHALGQVIAFNIDWKYALADLHRALNAILPNDITVFHLKPVSDPEFHPRFSAVRRTYRYLIINQPYPDPTRRRYIYHVSQALNVQAMDAAGKEIVGVHDFASFGKPPHGENTVREVFESRWFKVNKNELTYLVTANAFLYRMVRRIVGTLVQVGLEKITPMDFKAILEAKTLNYSATPAPACGLYLEKVNYPAGM